nr:hypothetical protein [Aliamphritea spongicola]
MVTGSRDDGVIGQLIAGFYVTNKAPEAVSRVLECFQNVIQFDFTAAGPCLIFSRYIYRSRCIAVRGEIRRMIADGQDVNE